MSKSDFVRTRLTHSDGEKPVSDMLNKKQIADLENFEGNAQALRILSKARHQSEINLPFSIISTLIKYPTRSNEIGEANIRHKMGCYQAEESVFIQIAKEVGTINAEGKVIRHPLTYLVEAADDIAYMTADLEDAVKSGVVNIDALLNFSERHIHHWEQRIMNPNNILLELKKLLIN